jgi:CARDB protein
MRRIVPLLGLLAALVFAPVASGAGPASAELLACERGAEPAAEFEARMGTVPGAVRMRMRFTLQVMTPGRSSFRRVAAPGFGVWSTSDPGTTRYAYTRRVENLVGPAAYRVVVRFRWLDAADKVIARDREQSRRCRQPDLRPNLALRSLAVEPGADESTRRYVAVVRNTGRRPVGAFEVAVGVLPPVTIPALGPRRERTVEVTGPACEPGAPITAAADPADLVDERSETDNELSVTC